jgi:hypothetical protein
MGLPFSDFVPDNAVDDISAKFVHPKHFLRAQHRLMVTMLTHVLLACLLGVLTIIRVHLDLHKDQLVIVLEQVYVVVLEYQRLVLA